jgi:HK97 family phage prohead protease
MEIERRYMPFELRAEGDGDGKLSGYAAVFDSLSEEMCGFREKIQKGAFADTILTDDVRALWNHDPNYVLGRNKAGTLSLREDDHGLFMELTPPDTQWARDLVVTIRRKDVTQMSFGFTVAMNGSAWEEQEDTIVRTLIKVRLFDVSPVTFPAYPDTEVQARAIFEEYKKSKAVPAAMPENKPGVSTLQVNQRKRELEIIRLKSPHLA